MKRTCTMVAMLFAATAFTTPAAAAPAQSESRPSSDQELPEEPVATEAEARLHSETRNLREQARAVAPPEEGENLLEATPSAPLPRPRRRVE